MAVNEPFENNYQKRQKNLATLFELNYDDLKTDECTTAFPFYDELSHVSEHYCRPTLIAEGGMKLIYRVWDTCSSRYVARAELKHPENLNGRERFLREARIGASLQHPNILPVYDIGIDDENGQPFFIMELLKGRTLGDVINDHYSTDNSNKTLSRFDLIEYFLKICDAVSYAHSQQILHLDLKPENIYVSDFGQVSLCDWGLSLQKGESDDGADCDDYSFDSTYATLCGKVKGTPGFMAPEQYVEGGDLDQRTDLFALGSILYSLLTGQPAVPGRIYKTLLENTCAGHIIPPSEISLDVPLSSSLEAVVLKALMVDKDERYQSVDDLKYDLNSYLRGYATGAENPTFLTQLKLLLNRNKRLVITISMAVTICMSLIIFFMVRIESERRKAVTAKYESDRLRIVAEKNLSQFKTQQELTDAEREKNEELLVKISLSENCNVLTKDILKIDHAMKRTTNEAVRLELLKKQGLFYFLLQEYNAASQCFSGLTLEPPYDQFYECSLLYKKYKGDQSRLSGTAFARLLISLKDKARDYIDVLYGIHMNRETAQLHDPDDYIPLANFMLAYLNEDWDRLSSPLKLNVSGDVRHLDLSHSKISRVRTSGFEGWNVLVPLQLSSLDMSNSLFSNYAELAGLSLESLNVSGCSLRPHNGVFANIYSIISDELIVSDNQYNHAELQAIRKRIAIKVIPAN